MRSVSPIGEQSPSSRGRLLTASEIRRSIFRDVVSEWWIRQHVAPTAKIALGRSTVVWYERDVFEWIEAKKGA